MIRGSGSTRTSLEEEYNEWSLGVQYENSPFFFTLICPLHCAN